MREIKFRAWDNIRKKMGMVACFYIHCESITFEELNDSLNLWDSEDYEIMQFTGLKDKKGKEIYEGDIVKLKDKSIVPHGEVKFFNGFIGVHLCDGCVLGLGFEEDSKIIGNIYENPELILQSRLEVENE